MLPGIAGDVNRRNTKCRNTKAVFRPSSLVSPWWPLSLSIKLMLAMSKPRTW